MNKYILLFVLNIPFVLYGYIKTYIYWESKKAGRIGLIARLGFWTVLLLGLIFADQVYNFSIAHNVTNSPPLSLADVVIATGVNFTLFIVIRLYSRLEKLESKFTQLITELSLDNERAKPRRRRPKRS